MFTEGVSLIPKASGSKMFDPTLRLVVAHASLVSQSDSAAQGSSMKGGMMSYLESDLVDFNAFQYHIS